MNGTASRREALRCAAGAALALGVALSASATTEAAGRAARAGSQAGDWTALEARWPGDRFAVLDRGEEALAWRLRAIDSATRTLDLQTFLWLEDGTGRAIVARLLAAADRGVRVRILLDDSFTVGEGGVIAALARHPEIEFRIYNPFGKRPDSLVLRQVENLHDFARVDRRMHNKSMIVDASAAIVGGRNLADEYFGRHPSANFRDLELVAVGPVARRLTDVFERYWQSEWAKPAEAALHGQARGQSLDDLRRQLAGRTDPGAGESAEARTRAWRALLEGAVRGEAEVLADDPSKTTPGASRPAQLAEALLRRFDEARSELILVSAYLVPTPELAAAIERAEQRGVQVRILTNSLRSNNHTPAHSAYRAFMHRLVRQGADLHEVRALAKDRGRYMLAPVEQKHLGLHAKAVVFDDSLSFVGSANLDPRSLDINTEMGLLVESRELNRRLRECIAADFDTRNAWHVVRRPDGRLEWVGDDMVLREQPAESPLQRLEDWFMGALPIRDEM